MRHENRVKNVSTIFLSVIACSHLACSQDFTTSKHSKKPLIIYNVGDYKKSIKADTTRRMILLQQFIPQLVVDLKYSGKNNFTGEVLYKQPAAYARLSAAILLKKINGKLAESGLGLKIFDAYRPWSVTKRMWQIVHDERYVANPAKGSGHNRGVAVDVTLIKLSSKEELPMPTEFDDFTEKAHHNYSQVSPEVKNNRTLLKTVMEEYGFVSLSTEWWHYSLPNAAQRYELLDIEFEKLKTLTK
jgi:D-alanyl-D-alanine dipeptidase